MKRFLLVFLALLALAAPKVASAHAVLIESTIENGAALDVAPAQVVLRFSEALEQQHSSIELYGEDSVPIGLERAAFPAADQMSVGLPATLRPGSYTLVYRVLSAIDGHDSVGFVIFSVATGAAPVSPSIALPPADAGPGAVAVATKSIELLAGMVVVGGLAWLVTLLGPAVARQASDLPAAVLRLPVWVVQIAIMVLLLGTLAEFDIRAAGLGDGTWRSVQYADVLSEVATSRWGILALTRVGATALLVPLVFLAVRSRLAGELAIGLSGLMLLTFSMSGHAAATPSPLLPIIADWVHLLTGALWLGGVLGLALLAWSSRRVPAASRTPLLARLVAGFSPLALASIALVVLTGVFRSLNQIPTLADVFATAYGRTLLIKLAALAGALLLGAVHWRRTSPRLRAALEADDLGAAARFSRTIGLESGLAIAVVLVAGSLSQTPHPVAAAPSAGTGGSALAVLPTPTPRPIAPLRLNATKDNLAISLNVDDDRPGNRVFTASISDDAGQIVPDRVRLRFEAEELNTGQQVAILERQPDGTFRGKSGAMSLVGYWNIELQVRRLDLPDVTVDWTVEIHR